MQLNIQEINDDINNNDANNDINNNDTNNNDDTNGSNNIYFIDKFNILTTSENYVENIDDEILSQLINYKLNYTVKDLTKICEYYKIAKTNKNNKEDIIHNIVAFESNYSNKEIVERRQLLWFFMNELKNDKHMKKYIIW